MNNVFENLNASGTLKKEQAEPVRLVMHRSNLFKATPSNYPELIALWEASVKATHHFLSEKNIQNYKLLIQDYYFDQLKLYYLTENQKIVGFIGLKRDFIQMLFIAPEYLGKGFGKKLINYAITVHQAWTVDVNEQNQNALGFYAKMGFKIISRSEKDASGKPFPVISMKLEGNTLRDQ